MGSKRPDRREFLKGGAALAGGLTLGAVTPAIGQTPAPEPAKSTEQPERSSRAARS